MGQAKLYGQKASGVDINGIIEDYYVYAGKKVNAGDFVEFINGVASQTTTTKTSANTTFHSAEVQYLSAVKINDNSIFLAYKSNNGSTNYFGTRVLTINGEKITVGTEYKPSAGIPYYISTTLVSTNKVAICFEHVNNYYASAIIAKISGTTISFGTYLSIGSGTSSYPDTFTQIEALDETHLLACWTRDRKSSSTTYGLKACVLTVSGTTLTANTITNVQVYQQTYLSLCKASSSKVLISYNDIYNGGGSSRLLTISGTSISASSRYDFTTYSVRDLTSCLVNTNEILIVYANNSNKREAILVNTSGKSGKPVYFYTTHRFGDTEYRYPKTSCLISERKVVIGFYNDNHDGYLQVVNAYPGISTGDITSIGSVGDIHLTGENQQYMDTVLVSENKIVFVSSSKKTDGTKYGTSRVYAVSENSISSNITVTDTVYETQVQKATSNIYGVAKTEGIGGTSTAHKDKVSIYTL